MLQDAPKRIYSTNSRSSGQPKNDARHFFSTLHPLYPVIFATATVVAFVLLRNSRFNFRCYTQREAMPTQKSARKWRCDLSRHLARKVTKGIHSCKQASLNRPIGDGENNNNSYLNTRIIKLLASVFQNIVPHHEMHFPETNGS